MKDEAIIRKWKALLTFLFALALSFLHANDLHAQRNADGMPEYSDEIIFNAAPPSRDWTSKAKDCCREAWDCTCKSADLVCQDYRHYYSCQNLVLVAAGIAVAAPFANTNADQEMQTWTQDMRNSTTDRMSSSWKYFGNYVWTTPAFIGAACIGKCFEDYKCGSVVEEWGCRSLRALVVGAPPVGFFQLALGASRPESGSSRWRSFDNDNGVSGHAFVGAVPFLTAASMCENRCCKFMFFGASFLTAWSRVNDNDHYISQSALGWWLAFLATVSVDETERDRKFILAPMATGESTGMCIMLQY